MKAHGLPVREWPPCWVCGRRAPYVHGGLHYCTDNACQLVAAGSWTVQQARADLTARGYTINPPPLEAA